jgi:hypothetical protein
MDEVVFSVLETDFGNQSGVEDCEYGMWFGRNEK